MDKTKSAEIGNAEEIVIGGEKKRKTGGRKATGKRAKNITFCATELSQAIIEFEFHPRYGDPPPSLSWLINDALTKYLIVKEHVGPFIIGRGWKDADEFLDDTFTGEQRSDAKDPARGDKKPWGFKSSISNEAMKNLNKGIMRPAAVQGAPAPVPAVVVARPPKDWQAGIQALPETTSKTVSIPARNSLELAADLDHAAVRNREDGGDTGVGLVISVPDVYLETDMERQFRLEEERTASILGTARSARHKELREQEEAEEDDEDKHGVERFI